MAIQDLTASLDLKQNLNIYATCKQFDSLNLILSIYDNSVQADLTNYNIRLRAMKYDQVPLIQEHIGITISTNPSNMVNIEADEQLTTTSGKTPIELQFINKTTGKKKATFNLVLMVVPSTVNVDGTISIATYTLLQELENKLDQASDFFENIDEAINANTALGTSITNSETAKTNLDSSISIANTTTTNLGVLNTEANITKSALNTSKVNADASKAAIDISKTNADASKVALDLSIDEANTFVTEHGDIINLDNRVTELASQTSDMENKIDRPKSLLLYDNAIKNNIPINALNQSKRAITLGVLNVAFWGDSVTEGKDQVYSGDSYVNRVIDLIKKTFPNVTINFQNFGLAGKGISDANNSSFVGGTSDTTTTFNRSWSTTGKSWKQHVKDFAPDLLVVAFGMNDSTDGLSARNEVSNLQTLTTYVNSWAKVPSIVLVPTILPTTNSALYSQRQDVTNSVARATREFAKNNGYPIADANRLFQILRDGKDEVLREGNIEYALDGWGDSTKWTGDTSSFTKGNNVITTSATNKFVTRSKSCYNGVISLDIKFNNIGDNAYIDYRLSDLGRYEVVLTGGTSGVAKLFKIDSGTPLQSIEVNLDIAVVHKLVITFIGTNHIINIDGVDVININDYSYLHDGTISFGAWGSVPTYSNFALMFLDSSSSNPIYTEAELLGTTSANDSGNGVNHPSGLGHAIYYLPTFYDIVNELTRPITTSGVFIPTKVASSWGDPTAEYPTPSSGERLFYKVLTGNYDKNKGISLRRLDTGTYYTLSTTAVDTASLVNLAPNTFAYFKFGTSDIMFITVPSNGTVTWDCDLYRFQ